MDTPLFDALSAHVARQTNSYHTPGHKNGRLVPKALREAWGAGIWRYDATEITGLDNLAHPEGVLAESMKGWAKARGCAEVQYLLGGTSLGLKAALYALCRGKKVFVPRHAHQSIYQGLALAGATPVFLPVTFDDTLHIPLGIAVETLKTMAAQHPDCQHMVVVHPTYHGITWQNAALFQGASALGITTIVDEAHGAHFYGEEMPASSIALGADVVIASAHKTLPCLTQASVMMISNPALVDALKESVRLLHTTSPSYLLMASLEMAGAWLFAEGPTVMAEGRARIERLRAQFADNPVLTIAEDKAWHSDPFKCYLVSAHVSGETLGQHLEAHGQMVEMCDGTGALLLMPLDGGDAALADCLTTVANALAQLPKETKPQPCYLPTPPPCVVPVAEAWMAPRHYLPLKKALHHVAGGILEAYPPGIPLVVPGERITQEVLDVWQRAGHSLDATVAVLS